MRKVKTIMFTDLEKFTEMVRSYGAEASGHIMDVHNDTIKECVEQWNGEVVKYIGDAVLSLFDNPSDGINSALSIQHTLNEINKTNNDLPELKVRIGLHQGEIPDTTRKELISSVVNCASRVMSAADGGQILVTPSVHESGYEFIDKSFSSHLVALRHGRFVLKGIGPMQLIEIADSRIREPSAPQSAALQGQRLHRLELAGYEIMDVIGEGGMGIVYLAESKSSSSQVAIKVLKRDMESNDLARAKFIKEAQAVAALDHPGIINIQKVHTTGEPLFFVMDVVEGTHVDKLPFHSDWAGVASTIGQLCKAVQHAHENGVLHHDIKPNNIIITPTGMAVLLDFGLHLALEKPQSSSPSSSLFGAPEYISPEQACNGDTIGVGSDIYSLGVVLFQLIAGKTPFESNNVHSILAGHIHESPPLRDMEHVQCPEDLQKICLKALEKHPENRYASMAEMDDDLQRFCEGLPVLAKPTALYNVVETRAKKHTGEIKTWLDCKLITNAEYSRLTRPYRRLERSGTSSVLEPRMVHLWLLFLYLGGWLVLNGSGLWLSNHWDELSSFSRVAIGLLPTVTSNLAAFCLTKQGRLRAAFVLAVVGALSLPISLTVMVHETELFDFYLVEKGLFGSDTDLVSHPQMFLVWALSLLWGLYLMVRTKATTISSIVLFLFICLYLTFIDLFDLIDLFADEQATLALYLIPLCVVTIPIGFHLSQSKITKNLSIPWFATTLLLIVIITQTIAFFGPEQWIESDSIGKVAIVAGLAEGYDINDENDVEDAFDEALEQLRGILISICGVFYLYSAIMLRRKAPVDSLEAYSLLFWLAPLSFLTGLSVMLWQWEWVRMTIFNSEISPISFILLLASVYVLLYASSVQIRFFVLCGMLYTAFSLFYIAGVLSNQNWPLTIVITGILILIGTILWMIRKHGLKSRSDFDDIAEHGLARDAR